jgi:hypothetical protein
MWHEILHGKKILPTSSTAYWLGKSEAVQSSTTKPTKIRLAEDHLSLQAIGCSIAL